MRLVLALIVASLTLLGTVGCGGSKTDTGSKKNATMDLKLIGDPKDLGVKSTPLPVKK